MKWLVLALVLASPAAAEEQGHAQAIVGKPVGRGEYSVDIARLDERIAQLRQELKVLKESNRVALELARTELARRLEDLNHETARILKVNEDKVSAEEFHSEIKALNAIANTLERNMAEQSGRLWLPMLGVAAIASTLSAGAVRYLFGGGGPPGPRGTQGTQGVQGPQG